MQSRFSKVLVTYYFLHYKVSTRVSALLLLAKLYVHIIYTHYFTKHFLKDQGNCKGSFALLVHSKITVKHIC